MIIGLCGKSGSGKSTIAKYLGTIKDNVIVVDIDKIGHDIYKQDNVRNKLVKVFGNSVIKNNEVDRKVLGNIVFGSNDAMDKLSKITWTSMEKIIDEILKKNKNNVVVLDWLLLPKTKFFNLCDLRVLIDVAYEERLKRAMARDNITKEEFALRESASIDYTNYQFDYVIENKDLEKTKESVGKLL